MYELIKFLIKSPKGNPYIRLFLECDKMFLSKKKDPINQPLFFSVCEDKQTSYLLGLKENQRLCLHLTTAASSDVIDHHRIR